MTKDRFLADLKHALGGMTETERREVLYDYEEHFRMGLAEGKPEEQIARSLGNPRVIGKSYAIDALLEESREGGGVTAASVLRAVFASISLTFFNIIFILGPFLGLVGVMIGLWAAAVSLGLAGVAVFLSPLAALITPRYVTLAGMNPAFLLFAGIGVAGLGVLAVLGMWKLSGLFGQVIAAYVRFNTRIVTRRK
ncbi:MAG: DUF1700 domain-containing protein [Spirochaetia bacterium]|jgi:uncharacterized membrane protein